MIRKQFYIEAAQDAKLKRLAADQHCTEAEVVRRAIEELDDGRVENEVVRRLRSAGLLVTRRGSSRFTEEERRRQRIEYETWLATLPGPIGLSQAVIEDRAS